MFECWLACLQMAIAWLPACWLPSRLPQVRGEKMELGCDSDTGGQVSSGSRHTMLCCCCLLHCYHIGLSGFSFAPTPTSLSSPCLAN